MSTVALNRRTLFVSAAAFGVLQAGSSLALGSEIHVVKDPDCGCCKDWAAILEEAGFAVTVKEMNPEALDQYKTAQGVPAAMRSCHTGSVEGYALEGHVPVGDIRRLLTERPEAVGLAVPGMPYGSPGMGPEGAREAFKVFLILPDGRLEVFSSYEAA